MESLTTGLRYIAGGHPGQDWHTLAPVESQRTGIMEKFLWGDCSSSHPDRPLQVVFES